MGLASSRRRLHVRLRDHLPLRRASAESDLPRRIVHNCRTAGVWRTVDGGYFIVDRVVGKHEYITVAVGINANGTVKQIEIMEYNESYGYEVRDAAWRAQFVGKNAGSALQLNVDIKNISGATLSSKHITDGVKRLLQKYASSSNGR
jgi:uncharacterized protein with FMN-binding domain